MTVTKPALLALVLLIAALTPPAFAQRGPASVFAETVEPREFATRIEALGTLQANERVELALNAADRVTAVYFEDGQRVQEGQTLLSLATREQRALVEAAEAEVEEARRQLARIERLAEKQAVSQSELDGARRDMDQASANLRAVQSRLKDRILVAPFDGLLGFRMVSVGTFLRPGDVVATLVDDSRMRLDFAIPSIMIGAVAPGATILAKTDDLSGESFPGEVATINNTIDPVTRSVLVRAILPNEKGLLKAGMFMRVVVKADPRISVAVAEEAIESVGPESFVYVINEKDGALIANRRQIEIGARQAGYVEVTSGLEAGERIVTEGLIRVREGAPVVIRDKSMLLPDGNQDRDTVAGAGR